MTQLTRRRRLDRRLYKTALLASVAASMAVMTGCDEDFTPYNELDGLQLLGVRASHPSLYEGEAATLEALVYNDGADVDYAWTWCPVYGDPSGGFVCPVSNADLEPLGLPALELGAEPTATLSYPGTQTSLLETCRELEALPAAAHVAQIDCERGFPVYVAVTVTASGQSLTAIKAVELLVAEEAVANTNPTIMEVRAGGGTALGANDVTSLTTGTSHDITVTLSDDSVQSFVPSSTPQNPDPSAVREDLLLTWFVTRGSTDAVHTGTFDDGVGLAAARENVWKTPGTEGPAQLMIVVRDNRGGITWSTHHIAVEGETP